MKNVVEKVAKSGNQRIMVTERGTSFGYNNLVVDDRPGRTGKIRYPVIFDGTHSVQKPGARKRHRWQPEYKVSVAGRRGRWH